MKLILKSALIGIATLGVVFGSSSPAQACGGFFCSQSQPVNQAAERIVFAENGNGTVTAIIQIMYEGPSENFSWLLPISSVPVGDEIGVASNLAFQRLQQATNPNYSLTTRVEGSCRLTPSPSGTGGTGGAFAGGGGSAGSGGGPSVDGGVTVEASGVVGAFEWTVISLDVSLENPEDVAVTWLGDNGYDVPEGAPALLRPYLVDGLYLLALRLTKGADVGSIRPIVLTYSGTHPSIPVKLTAVAANEDMGVMAWVLGSARAVPQNYLSLELNEARINWFNASSNYNDVVIAAADDAGGQGFVTEFAGDASSLANRVWTAFDEQQWASVQMGPYGSFSELFDTTYGAYGSWDGYWDAVSSAVTLPANVTFADFKLCPNCYSAEVQYSPGEFMTAIEDLVIEPVRRVQEIIDAHPAITRLYTTLSAEEMTLDPLFTFNPDLGDVSNQHTAERIIECSPDLYQWEAPWRIEFPQGGTVRGLPEDVGTWPAELADAPPNFRILREAESGAGRVLEDNSGAIGAILDDYNATVPVPTGSAGGSGGSAGGGEGGGASGSSGTGGAGDSGGVGGAGGSAGRGTSGASGGSSAGARDGGCAIGTGGSQSSLTWAAFGLALLAFRRRRAPRV
jgi:MYXO-CTERM domain-containing protein